MSYHILYNYITGRYTLNVHTNIVAINLILVLPLGLTEDYKIFTITSNCREKRVFKRFPNASTTCTRTRL